jgi:hypothetical protein
MKSFHFSALVVCVGVSGFVAGCGGGSSSTSGGAGGGNPPAPAVTSISPTTAPAGSADLTLTVNGTGFLSSTVIQVGGKPEATTFVGATQVTAKVPAAQLASGAELNVVAVNGSQSSASGAAINLEVDNPSPTISSVAPSVETLAATSLAIAVTGTGFVPTTVIDVNGSARNTSFSSATVVNVTLTAADVSALGSLSLTAVNPTPGGGTSAAVNVPVNNPPVGIIQLNPSALAVGGNSPVTITVTGNTFIPASVVQVNGVARPTIYVNSSTLTFVATVTDQATMATLAVTVTNPAPGGGTSPVANFTIGAPTPTPVITSISPNPIYAGSPDTQIVIAGSGFTVNSTAQWNGANLVVNGVGYGYPGSELLVTVPAADLASTGTATVTVTTPTANPSVSNAVTVTISNPPPPTLTSISPAGGPVDTATQLLLNGTGFTANSTAAVNGNDVPVTYQDSTQLTANLPASTVALPGNLAITVTTPAPGGGTTAPLAYTAFLAISNNDIAYNATDGLLYASVPVSSPGIAGNSVVAIDPATGNVMRQIWVGSNPNKLALSTDGKQLFVGLDGSGAVAQVDLAPGTLVNQFSLGGGAGVYNAPYTAVALAAVPGLPNSVAVFGTNGIVSIYDSGVARPKNSSTLINTYFNQNSGSLSFGSSASALYVNALPFQGIEKLTVDSTGITAAQSFTASTVNGNIQYDNGRLYLSNGQVLDASTGALLGTFYATASTAAVGPVVSDSSLGRAFIGTTDYSNTGQVLAFDESTFNPTTASIPVNGVGTQGYPIGFGKIVRWGQNGIALNTVGQIFIFQSPVVKDLSASPADAKVTLTAPANAATGTAISYLATVSDAGPDQAQGVVLALNLDSSLIINSVIASQGSCTTGAAITCDLGNVASGASATVTVSATPTISGKIEGIATLVSTSYDPTLTNNQSTTSTTVTGSLYGAVPSMQSISPPLVQAGSGDLTLTVNGFGFSAASIVHLGVTALTTTYVGPTQLTATVPAAQIANYGWGMITVSNPTPGGGVSAILPLTIYGLINVPANGLQFDPFSQKLYATIPSASTTVTGNSIVAIDPVTGTIGTPILIGSEPNVMAETSDGKYLWVGLSGANSLAQFDLLQRKVTATIPMSISSTGVAATFLSAMPGSDTTLAIDTGYIGGSVGIFDVTGSTGTFRTNLSGVYTGNFPTFADASHLYAFDNYTSGAEFYRFSVDVNGLTQIDGSTLNGLGGGQFKLANGLVYGASGGIVNPSTTLPSQIATLSRPDFFNAGTSPFGVAVVPDPSTQKEFLMLENTAGTWAYGLVRYDSTTYLPEAILDMPASASSTLAGWTMLRWGQDGLALLSSADTQINAQAVTQVLLLRGPFVTPQLLETNPAASLTSSSASTIAHGAGNTMLTLTGTKFLPGVAVTWKGSYRTTTIVDATHVTVAIPASDLASTGTASLVATNPGAPASNTLTITIN